MARYPDAVWEDVGGGCGAYKGGPLKIVHHTTEGSSAEAAFSAYRSTGCYPQFTVDDSRTYQHLDTMTAGSALRNESGGVETNRDGAIQIEIVTFAGANPKSQATLERVADLCRWLEEVHDIPAVWPNGPPKYGTHDPGGHNRNSTNWNTKGGHYGHSQAPENSHWDPSYWPDQFDTVMGGKEVHIEVNGVNQDDAIQSYLKSGRSYMSIADWCKYAGYPGAIWDNDAETVAMFTQKTRCQLTQEDGSSCPNSTIAIYPCPVTGLNLFAPIWICQAHLNALTGITLVAPDPATLSPGCPRPDDKKEKPDAKP